MDVASAKLKRIEDLTNKIEKNRVFHKNDWESMNQDFVGYVNDTNNLYNEALKRVKEAGDTKGKSGGTEEFLYFEEVTQGHVKRAKALEEKHKKIDNDIRNGKIKPGKDIIDTMTPQERDEFKKTLTPEGRKELQKAYGKKMAFTSEAVPTAQEFAAIGFADQLAMPLWPDAQSTNNVCSDASKMMADFFVSPAEAGIGIGCTALCTNPATLPGCVACVLTGPATLVYLYKNTMTCLQSCSCAWYRFWCCLKKAGCMALWIATCA